MIYRYLDSYGLDSAGIKVGFFIFLLLFVTSYFLLSKYHLKNKMIILFCVVSFFGHILGGLFLYWYTIHIGSDSLVYFDNATQTFNGLGYEFACLILGYQKAYIFGNSLLGAFLVSSFIAFLGSLFYLLTFKILIDKIAHKNSLVINVNHLFYPAFLLLCWPSYFLWSAGLGKDNFIFFFVSLFLFTLVNGKKDLLNLLLLSIACLFIFLLRPYLYVIIILTAVLYLLFNNKINLKLKCIFFILIAITCLILLPPLQAYLKTITTFTGMEVKSIGDYVIYTQASMQEASASIQMPTYKPSLVFLFLPYFMLINLFLPLGIGATNLVTWLCSLENAFFLGWVIYLIKHREILKKLQQEMTILKFFLIYFIVGMTCLSIVNLNYGLAMREKLMYVPSLLIVMFLVYCYKQLISRTQ